MKKPRNLKEWQEMFRLIYWEKDKRDYSTPEVLLHLFEEMGELAEGLRKEDKEGVLSNIPDLFVWLVSFCNRMEIDLEKAVWWKYPGVCPYCFRESDCICVTEELKYQTDKKDLSGLRARRENMPVSLDEWQSMFNKIYGAITKVQYQVQIWFHFGEELAEISRAFRLNPKEDLEAELADGFAWLLAVCNKLDICLSELTWKHYPGRCPFCNKEECDCSIS